MKKKMIIAVIGGLLAMTSAIFAETLMIQSVSGDVKYKSDVNGKWIVAKVKDKIQDTYFIQVSQGAKVQIISEKGTIVRVDTQKSALVSDLLASMKGNTVYSKFNNLKSKLVSKGSDSGNGPTAVAGVRGDNIAEQNKVTLKTDLYWEQ